MSRPARRWSACLLAVALAAGPCAAAGAQTLYGAAAPPGAAYVRLFRAAGDGARPLALGPVRFEAAGPGSMTPYRPVPPDIYQLRSGGHSAEIIPRAGAYYTLALTAGGIRVFEDPAHTDPARAQLVLYNLSSLERVDLRTEDGKTQVIPPLAPGSADRVTVNAVPVRLAVFARGEALHPIGDPGLRRGSSYSAIVFEQEGRTAVLWVEAALLID
ncbi:MAG: alginate O-acetyltransferase AlgF [Spirochaetales bacterium]|nr:alginate O-acetyltransferase AlgF [Spirochaetales bacterium]